MSYQAQSYGYFLEASNESEKNYLIHHSYQGYDKRDSTDKRITYIIFI